MASLQDPWEHGPINLGYGTLVETVKMTGYARGSITVNADGTFAVLVLPQTSAMVYTNVSGSAGTTWVSNAAYNQSALAAQAIEARITSGGLRIFALFPETASSGVLFAGSFPEIGRASCRERV